MSKTKIAWTEHTWSPVCGCTKISDGCKFCYAEKMAYRLASMPTTRWKYNGLLDWNVSKKRYEWNGNVYCDESALQIPLKRKQPTMYFVPSMGDLFHKDVPFEFIDKVVEVTEVTPWHTYQFLTKRPERMLEYFKWRWNNADQHTLDCTKAKQWKKEHNIKMDNMYIPNVWLGTSISSPKDYENVAHLKKCSAKVLFLSIEPMIESIRLTDDTLDKISWVIVGAESKGAHPGRECKIESIRNVVQQCQAAGVKCSVKQVHLWKANEPNKKYYRLYETAEEAQSQFGGCKPKLVLIKDINKFPKDLQVQEMPNG